MRLASVLSVFSLLASALMVSCRKDDSERLQAIEKELKQSNSRLEQIHKNQIKEREGRAIENQKSYFQ